MSNVLPEILLKIFNNISNNDIEVLLFNKDNEGNEQHKYNIRTKVTYTNVGNAKISQSNLENSIINDIIERYKLRDENVSVKHLNITYPEDDTCHIEFKVNHNKVNK